MNRHTTLLKNVLEGINLWEASERYKWEDNQEVDEQKSIGVHNQGKRRVRDPLKPALYVWMEYDWLINARCVCNCEFLACQLATTRGNMNVRWTLFVYQFHLFHCSALSLAGQSLYCLFPLCTCEFVSYVFSFQSPISPHNDHLVRSFGYMALPHIYLWTNRHSVGDMVDSMPTTFAFQCAMM